MAAKEQAVAAQALVHVHSDGRTEETSGALGYGTSRPYEVILGFGHHPAWASWAVDVSVVLAGMYCTPASPAGRGNVRIYRHTESCVVVEMHEAGGGGDGVAEAHYPADVFCGFVAQVVEMYVDPPPLADEELAAQLEEWSTPDAI